MSFYWPRSGSPAVLDIRKDTLSRPLSAKVVVTDVRQRRADHPASTTMLSIIPRNDATALMTSTER
jgi:hypothetical protein